MDHKLPKEWMRSFVIATLTAGFVSFSSCYGAFVPSTIPILERSRNSCSITIRGFKRKNTLIFLGMRTSPVSWKYSDFRIFNSLSNDELEILKSNVTHRNISTDEANRMLLQAKKLRAEATEMELALVTKKLNQRKQKELKIDTLLNRIFPESHMAPVSPQNVAARLRKERFSEDDLIKLLDFLYKRRKMEIDRTPTQAPNIRIDSDSAIQYPTNQTAIEQTSIQMNFLSLAASILDEETATKDIDKVDRRWEGKGTIAVNSRIKEWSQMEEIDYQRKLSNGVEIAWKETNMNFTLQNYIASSLGIKTTHVSDVSKQSTSSVTLSKDINRTETFDSASMVPMWVPSSLLGPVVFSRTSSLDADDVRVIKEKILSKSRFFCTSSDSIPRAAVFRGNFRFSTPSSSIHSDTQSKNLSAVSELTTVSFNEIQLEMEKEGLAQRVQLFLLEDPEWRPDYYVRESKPKPVILALPNDIRPVVREAKLSIVSIVLKLVVTALTMLTTLQYSVRCYALNPNVFSSIVYKHNLGILAACTPVFAGVYILQGIHEIAHRIVAKKQGIRVGLSLPIPSTHLGTFGYVTPILSFPPDRSALLDFSLSGPIAGIVASTLLMIIGSIKTVSATHAAIQTFPVVSVALLKSSFLAGSILTYWLPKAMMVPQAQPIPIHPFFMIGFSGVLASAMNLLPIFRLDGGRACTAAVGPRINAIASAWTLLFLLSLGLSGSGLAWAFGGFVLLFQRQHEIPARNEVKEVNDVRIGVWIASIVSAVLALAPFPGGPGML